jgi:hypothetical protein
MARAGLLDVPRHERRPLEPGERCASTSNRNFEGRQGRGGRTHLMSPAMAAAAAIAGHLVDVRKKLIGSTSTVSRCSPAVSPAQAMRADRPAHPRCVPPAAAAARASGRAAGDRRPASVPTLLCRAQAGAAFASVRPASRTASPSGLERMIAASRPKGGAPARSRKRVPARETRRGRRLASARITASSGLRVWIRRAPGFRRGRRGPTPDAASWKVRSRDRRSPSEPPRSASITPTK